MANITSEKLYYLGNMARENLKKSWKVRRCAQELYRDIEKLFPTLPFFFPCFSARCVPWCERTQARP